MSIGTFTRSCNKNVAGNLAVLLTEAANIDSVTVSGGEVTAISMVGSATFKQVQANIDGVIRTEEGAGLRNNISYTHQVEMFFSHPSAELNALRDSLTAASSCGIVALVVDGNGKTWLSGYNETDGTDKALYVQQDNLNSGQESNEEDVQEVDIILESDSGYQDLPFDDALNTSISDALAAGGGSPIEWSSATYGPELHTSANAASDPNGNEADATTGWTSTGLAGTGANIFQSQSAVKNVGSYALQLDADDTPTSGAMGVLAIAGVTTGYTYRITFDWRHKGSGGDWALYINGAAQPVTITNTETSFNSVVYEIASPSTTLNIQIRENNVGNDGGVFIDNVSVKEKL